MRTDDGDGWTRHRGAEKGTAKRARRGVRCAACVCARAHLRGFGLGRLACVILPVSLLGLLLLLLGLMLLLDVVPQPLDLLEYAIAVRALLLLIALIHLLRAFGAPTAAAAVDVRLLLLLGDVFDATHRNPPLGLAATVCGAALNHLPIHTRCGGCVGRDACYSKADRWDHSPSNGSCCEFPCRRKSGRRGRREAIVSPARYRLRFRSSRLLASSSSPCRSQNSQQGRPPLPPSLHFPALNGKMGKTTERWLAEPPKVSRKSASLTPVRQRNTHARASPGWYPRTHKRAGRTPLRKSLLLSVEAVAKLFQAPW